MAEPWDAMYDDEDDDEGEGAEELCYGRGICCCSRCDG